MVGQGVLRECVLAPDVEQVLTVGRRAPTAQPDKKMVNLVHADFTDFSPVARQLAGYDACFYCLGVTSVGMTEADYSRVTLDYTVAAARVLAQENPGMTFVFVSGTGTDSTEQGRTMWARVKGKAENAVMRLPFKAAYMFRPGMIQPKHGITSRTRIYRMLYAVLSPLLSLLRVLSPRLVTTTEIVGQAMLRVARAGAPQKILENRDINALV